MSSVTPEYRYLGVIQTPKDTGRRDTELCARRAQTAWAHARSLIASPTLPWALKQAWFAGRVLPAAYATLATNIAVSQRALAPLHGFFETAARNLLQSWRYGHFVTRPTMLVLLGLCAPEHASVIARARLVLLLLDKSPPAVWELFEAAWNRDTPWCQLLVDSCRQFLPAVRYPSGERVSYCTLQALRQVRQPLSKAIRFLSRWGTVQAACCALWRDISTPRERRIIGAVQALRCHICQEVFPSRHAVAAHIHRKHSVVSCYTKLTNGTVCLWCHTEMHSTDRLKYHLRTTPVCLHGLRVTVGEVYEYGTGTKRTGQRQHRGLPALRLPGPINATPAQRKAAAEGRPCTAEELVYELRSRLGVSSADEWPTGPVREAYSQEPAQDPVYLQPQGGGDTHAGLASPALTGEVVNSLHSGHAPLRWYRLVTASQADSADEHGHLCLSPLWARLVNTPGMWCLPVEWHRLWPLWHAMQAAAPWDVTHKRAFGILRGALSDKPSPQGPSHSVVDVLSATVAFRKVCECVQRSGAFWIRGRPSTVGRALIHTLLPHAATYAEVVGDSLLWVVAHINCPRIPGFLLFPPFVVLKHAWPVPLCSHLELVLCTVPCRWIGAELPFAWSVPLPLWPCCA